MNVACALNIASFFPGGFPFAWESRGSVRVDDSQDVDRADIAGSRNGDEAAFARLVARYQGEIGAYMWRFTRDRVCWEELVHDVFVAAYFSLNGFRGDAPFLHWLRKIATRTGYRFWKTAARERERRKTELRELPPRSHGEDPHETAERAEWLHALLTQLAPRDRMILTLLHLEELSVKEVAELTGWSLVMVRVQAFRARNKLKVLVEKHVGSVKP